MLANDLRLVPVLVCNGLLYAGLGWCSHVFAKYGFTLSSDGLYLVFPLCFLRLGGGLVTALLAGALSYAGTPLGADQGLFMLGVLFLCFLPFRAAWRRDEPVHLAFYAAVLTFAAHLLVALLTTVRLEGAGGWKPALAHALLGSLAAGLLAPLWVEAQRRLFLGLGVDLAAEPRRY